jgi:uncharacterized membrane protein
MLLGMFPANVYAAVEGLPLGGSPATPLLPRTLMQLLFLAATLSVVAYHARTRRPALSTAHDKDNAHEATTRPAATVASAG